MSPSPLAYRADQVLAVFADAYAFHHQRRAAPHYLDALASSAIRSLQAIGYPNAAREVAQSVNAIQNA